MSTKGFSFISAGLLLWIAMFNSSCDNTKAANKRLATIPRAKNPLNFKAIDSCIRFAKDGQIALRTGADAISYMLRQMNETDRTYSHCGIIMMEDGYPFVYHSIGGEDNPDATLRRDSITAFFNPAFNERIGIAVLDIDKTAVKNLHTIVRRYYRQGVPFDMDFDLATNDKFYCSEFVYKAVQEAVHDTTYFKYSMLKNRKYIGIDNLFEKPHGGILYDVPFK